MVCEDSIRELLSNLSKCSEASTENSDNTYNIFEVLGVEYKEVIMCRFIGDLLDPKGRHGLGSKPLRCFIKDVIKDKDAEKMELENASVNLEKHIDNDRRIDIVIDLQDKIYPIEVKIWAEDQPKQLEAYYRYYFDNNKQGKVYYLTPNGKEPSEGSKGELTKEQISCISFKKHIRDWLENVQKSASDGNVGFIIESFKEVIDKMSKEYEELVEISNVLELDREQYNSDLINGAVVLLKYQKEIWDKVRRNYIRSIISSDGYELIDHAGTDKKDDNLEVSHILLDVRKNGKTVAYICVETNLYIVKKKNAEKCDDGWIEYNSNYQWKYIDNGNKHIALGSPTELTPVTMELKDYLPD